MGERERWLMEAAVSPGDALDTALLRLASAAEDLVHDVTPGPGWEIDTVPTGRVAALRAAVRAWRAAQRDYRRANGAEP